MSDHKHDSLFSIELADLTAVVGGTHTPGHKPSANAEVIALLKRVNDSLKTMSTQTTSNNTSQLLPLLLAKGGAPR